MPILVHSPIVFVGKITFFEPIAPFEEEEESLVVFQTWMCDGNCFAHLFIVIEYVHDDPISEHNSKP